MFFDKHFQEESLHISDVKSYFLRDKQWWRGEMQPKYNLKC